LDNSDPAATDLDQHSKSGALGEASSETRFVLIVTQMGDAPSEDLF
jgi:hypothetical protein